MERLTNFIGYFILIVAWIAGAILANGFWSTFFSIVFIPWGWYLIIEKCLQSIGWI